MEFSKYEASGNDFILIDGLDSEPGSVVQNAPALCDRHFGIGADGLILLLPSDLADVRMQVINADGSEAEMCGNGIRALFLFAIDRGRVSANSITVETPAGIMAVERACTTDDGQVFRVDMGVPRFSRADIPVEGAPGEPAVGLAVVLETGESIRGTCVSMGNPHCVHFTGNVKDYPLHLIGPMVENNRAFPARTNFEVAQVEPGGLITARVWERGVGETLACGTGACACLVAARLEGLVDGPATVILPGGSLEISWEDSVTMIGPARKVFQGSIDTA